MKQYKVEYTPAAKNDLKSIYTYITFQLREQTTAKKIVNKPIKLHYTQTFFFASSNWYLFYYPIKLHYTKTMKYEIKHNTQFYYPIKLHYTQTCHCS